MRQVTGSFGSAILAAAIVISALLVGQASGRRPMAPRPPVVATVKIEPLFNGLEQRANAKIELERMETDLREQAQTREQSLKNRRDGLAGIVDETRRIKAEDEVALEQLEMNKWLQQSMAELELEKALRLKQLYISIKTAIEELSEAEGYDIVIVDDSIDEPIYDLSQRIAPQMQVLQQISTRHILYLEPGLDITHDLIVRMNNAFANKP